MPVRGLTFIPSPDLLTADEIETVGRAAVSVGFRRFRLTGGEPTLRADIVDIVGRLARIEGVADVAMTTNAVLLPQLAAPLKAAGLTRINVHVDTFHPERLKKIMRFGSLDEIEAGLEAAEAAGLAPIKVNVVVTRDYNDMDVADIARRALDRGWQARFIELMPLGGGDTARLALSQFVPSRETRQRIEAEVGPLVAVPNASASDESRNFRVEGKPGRVGFISPVSEPYCGACNRMRLTADGRFHLCLLHDDELDVRAALRSGGGIAAAARILALAVGAKPTGHQLDQGVSTEERQMFQIGG
jgi:cyclic pyranopterin phosphate synthase